MAGLVSLSGQLYTMMNDFVSDYRGAPSLARIIRAEIRSFHHSLSNFQTILTKRSWRTERAILIPAEHLLISFADAVLLLSELEAVVRPLTGSRDLGIVGKSSWALKQTKIVELVTRLQWQKHTLLLQLNILQWYAFSSKPVSSMVAKKLA